MPVSNSSVTVTDSATPLFGSSQSRRRFIIRNDSGVDLFVGGSGVTTASGLRIATNTSYEVSQQFPTDPSTKFVWYGILSTGSQSIKIVEVTG